MRRIAISSLLAGLLVLTLGLGAASAAPTNNPKAQDVVIDCSGEENGDVYEATIVNAGNPPVVSFVTDSNTRTIPVSLTDLVVAIDGEPTDIELPPSSIGQGQRTGQQDRLMKCPGEHFIPEAEFPVYEELFGLELEPGEALSILFTAEFMITPARP
jgi:hypothetical protein